MLLHTGQVAAIKFNHRLGPFALRFSPPFRNRLATSATELTIPNVARRFAIRKPVWEDLVENAVTHPGWRLIICQQVEVIRVGWHMFLNAGAVVPPGSIEGEQ